MSDETHPCEVCHYPTEADRRICPGCRRYKFVCRKCDEIVSCDFESREHERVCRPCLVEDGRAD